jgi:hypothetical protein
MLTTYEEKQITLDILHEIGISIAQFANYTIYKPWICQRIFAGLRPVTNYESGELLQVARELKALRDSFGFSPDWRDTRAVSGILKNRREQAEAATWKEKQLRRNTVEDVKVIDAGTF